MPSIDNNNQVNGIFHLTQCIYDISILLWNPARQTEQGVHSRNEETGPQLAQDRAWFFLASWPSRSSRGGTLLSALRPGSPLTPQLQVGALCSCYML